MEKADLCKKLTKKISAVLKMVLSAENNFYLKWNDFAENVSGAFKELRSESDFFDVTLACADSEFKTLQAHKLILSACSNFFKGIFRGETNASKHPNPYIFLHGVTYNNLTSILDFIYNGEVNIEQDNLNSFLTLAEELQIKGLTKHNENVSDGGNHYKKPTKSPGPKIGSTIYPEEILEVTVKGNRKIFAPRSSIKIENADNQEMTNEIIDQENIKNHDSTLSLNLNAKSDTSHEFFGEEYDDLYENNETDVEEMNGFEQGNLLKGIVIWLAAAQSVVQSTVSPLDNKFY